MYSKIFKNCQVSVGTPFRIKTPLCFEALQNKNFDAPISFIENNYETENPKYILENAQKDAALILKEAELEVAHIVEEATKEATRLISQAEEKIKKRSDAEAAKGFEYGYAEAKKQYECMLNEAAYAKEQTKVEYKEILAGMEADIIKLVLDIARKVIGMELASNKETLLSLVSQAVEGCSCKEGIVLRVSEEDYTLLIDLKDRIKTMTGIDDITIKKDTALTKGGCVVDTYFGSVDAGFDTKMKKIEEAFKEILGIG